MQQLLREAVDIFERGGPIMWPLLVLSVVGVALSAERALFWLRLHHPGRRRRNDRLAVLLREGDVLAIRASAKQSLYDLAARDLADRRAGPTAGVELVERFRPSFERFHASLATIIAAAPLLGILGTVLGIIESFELLGSSEAVGDVAGVAAGIAEALITTAFGLIVALLTLFPHMLFRAQADRCLGTLERLAAAAQQRPRHT